MGLWLDTTELTPEQTVDAILARTSAVREPIVVRDYDASWPELFEEIAGPLRAAHGRARRRGGARRQHVGRRLAAKPIVDLDVALRSPADVPQAIERLRTLGCVYQGDKGVPGREAFLWPAGARPHHLYVVVAGGEPHAAHIAFREFLREHPDAAAEYAALKRRLAERHGSNRLGYTEAKGDFVARILAAAQRSARSAG